MTNNIVERGLVQPPTSCSLPKKRLEQFVFPSAVRLICGIRDFEVNLQAIQRYFLALEAFTDIIIQEGIQILWKGEYGELVVDA